MKKVLIFYAPTGGGHLRAAQAIAKKIKELDKDIKVVLVNGLNKNECRVFKINPEYTFYLASTRFLRLFNLLSRFFGEMALGNKIFWLAIKLNWGPYLEKVIGKEKPDIIVSVHHHIQPSSISGYQKIVPFITVVTDLASVPRIWFNPYVDMTIVPTQAEYERAIKKFHIPKNRIKVLGFPVQDEFLQKLPVHKINNHILVVGGGSGSGRLYRDVRNILTGFPMITISAVCGVNKKLIKKLKKLKNSRLEIVGFVDNMPDFYNKADLVVTKPGPGTVLEAAAMHKPLVVGKSVGRQEDGNIHFVVRNHLGIYNPKANRLHHAITEIYKHYRNYTNAHLDIFGANMIAEYILNQISLRSGA